MKLKSDFKYVEKEIQGKVMRFRECSKCHKYKVPESSFWDTCPKCRGKKESYYYNR